VPRKAYTRDDHRACPADILERLRVLACAIQPGLRIHGMVLRQFVLCSCECSRLHLLCDRSGMEIRTAGIPIISWGMYKLRVHNHRVNQTAGSTAVLLARLLAPLVTLNVRAASPRERGVARPAERSLRSATPREPIVRPDFLPCQSAAIASIARAKSRSTPRY
jgi:hypothetical protein